MTTVGLQTDDTSALIATFSSDSHDPITYLNDRLAAVGGVARSLDDSIRSTQSLIAELESASLACTTQLDALIDDMIRVAPRLGYDVELLRGDAHAVQQQVRAVEPRRQALHAAGGEALVVLDECDAVKLQLLKVKEALDGAKAWQPAAKCEEEVRAFVEARQWAAASSAVVAYENLLRVWRATSGHDERAQALDRARRALTEARGRDQHQQQQQQRAARNEESRRTSLDSKRSDDTADSGYYSSFLRKTFIRG